MYKHEDWRRATTNKKKIIVIIVIITTIIIIDLKYCLTKLKIRISRKVDLLENFAEIGTSWDYESYKISKISGIYDPWFKSFKICD